MPTPIIIVLLFLCQTIKNYDGRSTGCKGSVRALVSAIVLVACTEGARVALMTEAGAHILGGGRGGGGVLEYEVEHNNKHPYHCYHVKNLPHNFRYIP